MPYGQLPDGCPIHDEATGEVIGEAMPLLGRDQYDHAHDWRYITTNEPWIHERCSVCEGSRVRHVVDGDWYFVELPRTLRV